MKSKPLPPLDKVQAELDYNSETGEFTRLKGRKSAVKSVGKKYIQFKIDGVHYQAHRLAWLLHTGKDPGEMVIDHINGDKRDNRIANLRMCTQQQNRHNARGFRGITKVTRGNTVRWRATVTVEGRKLSRSEVCPLLARMWYVDKQRELRGEYCPL